MNEEQKKRFKEYRKKYDLEHKDKIKEAQHKWYLKNRNRLLIKRKDYYKENKKQQDKANRLWRENNKEKFKEYQKSCYIKFGRKWRNNFGREKFRKSWLIWSKKNPEKITVLRQKRRESKKSFLHLYTHQEWQIKLKNTLGICPNCDKYKGINNLTLDHIIPLSKAPYGFIYTINDVQPLCLSCNSSKGNKS